MKSKKLYHFTSTENAIQYILPSLKLRMNSLGKMNDPKENLMHIINSHLYSEYKYKIGDITETVDAMMMSKETKIVSFSTDKKNKDIETTKGYNLQRMWAQYGANHTGICIVIDYEKFKFENTKIIEEYNIKDNSVEYNNKFCVPPSFTPLVGRKPEISKSNSLSRHDEWKKYQSNPQFVKEQFFTKNIDWEGECEYRFLTFVENSNNEIYLSIKNSLIKVITGLNFSKYYLPSLERLVGKDKIDKLIFDKWSGDFEISEN